MLLIATENAVLSSPESWRQQALADIYRRQAATHDNPAEWQWEQKDYITNLSGISAMVKNLAGR